jgi:hypothetical protein
LLRSYLPRSYVDQAKADRTIRLGPDDLTVRQATEILGCKRGRVKQLVYGGILTAKKSPIPWKGRYRRRGALVLSRSEVEAYQRNRSGASRTPRFDLAVNLLRTILSDGERHLAKDVQQRVIEQGVSLKVVMAAARKLKVKIEKLEFRGPYYWRLPGTSASQNGKAVEAQAKRNPGRPEGAISLRVKERREKMLREWDEGKFQNNKSAAGRKHGFDRSDATKIINEHEKAKRLTSEVREKAPAN